MDGHEGNIYIFGKQTLFYELKDISDLKDNFGCNGIIKIPQCTNFAENGE